jgi:hypothetical protein
MEEKNFVKLNLPAPNYDNILGGNYTSADVELVEYKSKEEKFVDEDWEQEYFIIYNSYLDNSTAGLMQNY